MINPEAGIQGAPARARRFAIVAAAIASTLAFAASARAATINVADGAVLAAVDGKCSLVEAINNANTDSQAGSTDCTAGSGADTLALGAASSYDLTVVDNTFFGFTGLPLITTEIKLDGNGATISRQAGAPGFRLLEVAPNGNLTVFQTVLSNGLARGGDGGDDTGTDDGGGGGGGAGIGGAILNRGVLVVNKSTLTANSAQGGDGGDGGDNTPGHDDGGGAGGGGLGGNGGKSIGGGVSVDGGDGGGGWGGDGGVGGLLAGGGGGGTFGNGAAGGGSSHGPGGPLSGGDGGDNGFDGVDGGLGGGGGGAGDEGNGGKGGTGGGGGGGGENDDAQLNNGGPGGFGGGGGGGGEDGGGGNGGFGSGGGGANNQTSGQTTGTGGFGAGDGGALSTESGGGGGGAGMGGAIFNDGGAVTITNSTFNANNAVGGSGGAGTPGGVGQPGQAGKGLGGAVFSRNGNVLIIEGTLAGNTGQGGGVYLRQDGGQPAGLVLRNSLLADTAAASTDCVVDGTAVTLGSVTNLIETNSACPAVTVTTDPGLGGLGNNGGLTPTQLPAIGSPAINAGSSAGCTRTDQRNFTRQAGSACDIGATEPAPQVARALTVKYSNRKDAFMGTLTADAPECLIGKVTVFESARGKDPKVGRSKVNAASGAFKVKEKSPDSGRYYARTPQKVADYITCLAAKSKRKHAP